MSDGRLTYFVSDVHLGSSGIPHRELEDRFIAFLHSIPRENSSLYLVGDIFDFWYEYKYVIPSGHTRVLGALAELSDSGVKITFIPGNHDVWCYHYFEEELGMEIVRKQPLITDIDGKVFCIAHGDGLGKVSFNFRFLKSIFHSHFLQKLFSTLHPTPAFAFGYRWAAHSRAKHLRQRQRGEQYVFDKDKLPLFRYADKTGESKKIDYYIFGHYHVIGDVEIPSGGKMHLLSEWTDGGGDWFVFDGKTLSRHHVTELTL